MTKLPKANVIQDLTPSNVVLVAEAYLEQLCSLAQCDESRAKEFILTALRRAQRDRKIAWDDFLGERDKIETILHLLPHVNSKSSEIAVQQKWLDELGINYRVIWHRGSWIYLFENDEDAILFKLKW